MKIITPARLSWTEHQEPFAEDFKDCYFSSSDGLAETRHVFINGNSLNERWKILAEDTFIIGEIGFGTGLNFVAAWKLWGDIAPAHAHLVFVSDELHPLQKEDLVKAAERWPELKSFYDQLITQYPSLTPGFHTLRFDRVTLVLLLGDATEMFNEIQETDHPDFNRHYGCKFDAWFLDGFAPAKNPALWSDSLIQTIALLSKDETTLATFSAAGDMRRALESSGFQVQKQKGFANKREMVTAIYTTPGEVHKKISLKDKPAFISSPYVAPWYLNQYLFNTKSIPPQRVKKEVAIIGAGIAGCTIAHALARKGLQVTVIDAQSKPACEASGNLQAVLYSKFSSRNDDFAQFNLATFLYALRFYKQLLTHDPSLAIHLCGVLQLAWSADEQDVQNALRDFFAHYPDIAQTVTREQASDLAGVPVEHGGLFFPHAGWIHPANICEHLLKHENITTRFNQRITSLHYLSRENEPGEWQLMNDSHIVHTSPQVVIANAQFCQHFEQTQFLSLKHIRGQVTHATPTTASIKIKTVICGDGYIAPVHNNFQSFGATYTPAVTHFDVTPFDVTEPDHETNLQQLEKSSRLLRAQWNTQQGITGGRAHTRTATPDYFPLCGPVPVENDFLNDYALLRKNANANLVKAGSYYPDLYLFAGLGSRGMTYAPLCAEILSHLITRQPLLLPRTVIKNLNPARFIIRDLIKNRL